VPHLPVVPTFPSRPIQEAVEVLAVEVLVAQAGIDSQMTIEARAEISLLKLCLARRNSTESQ